MTLRFALVALALLGCKEREATSPAGGGSGTAAGSGPAAPVVAGPGATRTGTGPTLAPMPDAGRGELSAHQQFMDEPRDQDWARAMEQTILDRVGDLHDSDRRLIFVECRTAQCQISFQAPDRAGIAKAIARFEDEAGLRGIAQSMYIDAEPEDPLGRQQIVVYARFQR